MHIHFYCAGYGACWNKEYAPDMELVDVHSDMPWAFSQTFLQNLWMMWKKKLCGGIMVERNL